MVCKYDVVHKTLAYFDHVSSTHDAESEADIIYTSIQFDPDPTKIYQRIHFERLEQLEIFPEADVETLEGSHADPIVPSSSTSSTSKSDKTCDHLPLVGPDQAAPTSTSLADTSATKQAANLSPQLSKVGNGTERSEKNVIIHHSWSQTR